MKLRETNNGARGFRWRQRGFSMIELCVVIAIILIVSAMAVFSLKPALQDANCDSAMRQVIGQLRQAREYAITNRRYVQITFPTVAGFSTVVMTQRNDLTAGAGAANPVLSTVPVHGPDQFYVFTTLPDTPDGCGATFAIVFQCANGGPVAGMLFQSDGELVDGAAYQPINGTVFLGLAGQPSTARAITVLGSTGRVRGWKISGTTWTQF